MKANEDEIPSDTIYIKAERQDEIPTIVQIPKQLPKEQLIKIMPLEWPTNYEKAFQDTTPVIASDTKFVSQEDGSVTTIFTPVPNPDTSSSSSIPPIFQALMIRPVVIEDDIPIHSFGADGSVVYTDKVNGHFIWDVDPNLCDAYWN